MLDENDGHQSVQRLPYSPVPLLCSRAFNSIIFLSQRAVGRLCLLLIPPFQAYQIRILMLCCQILQKRRLASVLPYKTTSATSVAPPAPSESATPHLQSESANSGLPSTTASGAISRDPEEASPVTAPMRAKARKKRGGKKTVAAKAESYHFPDRIEKAPFDRDVGSAKEQPNRTGTGDQQAGRARNEAVDREVPSLDGSDAAETATSAKFASDGGSNSHVRGGLPKPGLAVLPPTEASSASENRHSEAYEGSEPPNAASESIVLENRVQTEGHAECPAAEAAEETVSAAARKRRRVVESLSTEEAQLLRALVLQAGTGSRSRADSGRNGTDSAGTRNGTDSGGTRGCQHCGSRGVSSSGGIDERSEGQLGGGAREASGGNRSSVERDGGGQETDVVAGVFATSQASKLQRVLLAMAVRTGRLFMLLEALLLLRQQGQKPSGFPCGRSQFSVLLLVVLAASLQSLRLI